MRALRLLALLSSGFLLAHSAAAQTGPYTERVSVNSVEVGGNAASVDAAFCADARYVAFASDADNLVPGDSNGLRDVFLRARHADLTRRISVGLNGAEPDGASREPALSADGRFIAFTSEASNLVAGDANGVADVFIHDFVAGVTLRVSVDALGLDADGPSARPAISADGRYVAFESAATDLVAGDGNGVSDVFLRDLVTGVTERLSVTSAGAQASGASTRPSLSPDGRFLAFQSEAPDLVAGDANGASDVFLHDRMTAITERVSVDAQGGDADGASTEPAVSIDGFTVAFTSAATDLVAGDTNGVDDVFYRDRALDVTVRASVDSSGAQASGRSGRPALIPDGTIIAFESEAPDLVAGDTNGFSDVFLRLRGTNVTERVSLRNAGGQANGPSFAPSCAVDARVVVFGSEATNLVPNDDNFAADAFVRNRGLGNAGTATTLVLIAEPRLFAGQRADFTIYCIVPTHPWWLLGSLNDGGSTFAGHSFKVGPSVRLLARGNGDGRGIGRWTSPPLPPAAIGRSLFLQAGVDTSHNEIHDSNLLERVLQ